MFEKRNLNLLPIEYKNKYLNRYILVTVSGIGGIFAVFILGMLLNLLICSLSIQHLQKENAQFNMTKSKIAELQKQIEGNQHFINEQAKEYFDFYGFMSGLRDCKPKGLTIISLESMDRMKGNESKKAEEQPVKDKKGNTVEVLQKPAQSNQKDEKVADKKSAEKNSENKPEETTPTLTLSYEKDLGGQHLVLRGISNDYQDVSTFIYKISRIPNVVNIQLTGIEEKVFNGQRDVAVVEAILEVK